MFLLPVLSWGLLQVSVHRLPQFQNCWELAQSKLRINNNNHLNNTKN